MNTFNWETYPMRCHAAILFVAIAAWSSWTRSASAEDAAPMHVIIIGCDGMSPDGILKAETPAMDRMMSEGAWSLRARAVLPTVSSPNWASIIMGAEPEQHGVTSNEWRLDKFVLEPLVRGKHGFFPTIFEALREQRPSARIGVFHDWDGFTHLFAHEDTDIVKDCEGPGETTREAMKYFAEAKPELLFIHLDHVDHAGHESGHGTVEYTAAVVEADEYIADIRRAVEKSGLEQSTFILVTADHGGKGKGHGGPTREEVEIPWILVGPGVARGHELTTFVNTYDTSPTVAFLLGLTAPPVWTGKVVREAITGN